MNAADYIGKRILVRLIGMFGKVGEVEEVTVLEVSPSGAYVLIKSAFGRKFWRAVNTISFVEALQPFEPHPGKAS